MLHFYYRILTLGKREALSNGVVKIGGGERRRVGAEITRLLSRNCVSSPKYPDLLFSPSTFICRGYRELFPRRVGGRSVKLSPELHVVSMLRMRGAMLPIPRMFL
jgi:hypothetical protein